MNVQEYISNGIVESYVLGLASAEERIEFEKMCQQYPEVLQARLAFELSLEKQAMQNAIESSADVKQKIFDQISSTGKVVSIAKAPVRRMNWWKIAAAAFVVLLAGSVWWNMDLKDQNKKLKAELSSSNKTIDEMAKAIQQPTIKMARMEGTENFPRSMATVYWDTTSHDVYLIINNLPKPASDKQYQLWALLNGKPIDMGMLEISEKPLQLYHMKNVRAAQAFAITLEVKGGSLTPKGPMYAVGKL